VKNKRMHRETHRIPAEALGIEQDRMHPVPVAPFTTALGETRTLATDQTIRFRSVRYSTPPGLIGHEVWARVDWPPAGTTNWPLPPGRHCRLGLGGSCLSGGGRWNAESRGCERGPVTVSAHSHRCLADPSLPKVAPGSPASVGRRQRAAPDLQSCDAPHRMGHLSRQAVTTVSAAERRGLPDRSQRLRSRCRGGCRPRCPTGRPSIGPSVLPRRGCRTACPREQGRRQRWKVP